MKRYDKYQFRPVRKVGQHDIKVCQSDEADMFAVYGVNEGEFPQWAYDCPDEESAKVLSELGAVKASDMIAIGIVAQREFDLSDGPEIRIVDNLKPLRVMRTKDTLVGNEPNHSSPMETDQIRDFYKYRLENGDFVSLGFSRMFNILAVYVHPVDKFPHLQLPDPVNIS